MGHLSLRLKLGETLSDPRQGGLRGASRRVRCGASSRRGSEICPPISHLFYLHQMGQQEQVTSQEMSTTTAGSLGSGPTVGRIVITSITRSGASFVRNARTFVHLPDDNCVASVGAKDEGREIVAGRTAPG